MVIASHSRLFWRTLLLTTIIFIIGIFVGKGVDELRSDEVFDTLQQNELDTQSYLIEQEFVDTFEGNPCSLAQTRLTALSRQLGELGYYLVSYEQKNLFKQKAYEYLLRKYFLLEIRAYTLFHGLTKKCNLQHNLILYFFDPDNFMSERQGKVLDVLVKKYPNISVFSINYHYRDDPALETVKLHHNVTKAPTLIINGNLSFTDFVSLEDLESLLAYS